MTIQLGINDVYGILGGTARKMVGSGIYGIIKEEFIVE
jgi:hypothetical protein